MSAVDDDFRAIRAHLKGYEARKGQMAMARAVASALGRKKHLVVEAPCGVGKSFAYLVPAIRFAVANKTRVVVCTANIALQEQLMTKDLPLLRETLSLEFTASLVKGMGNYVCPVRRDLAADDNAQLLAPDPDLEQLIGWSRSTASGDHSEIPFAVAAANWNRINGVTELCTGRRCPEFARCPAMKARAAARDATVIVTNYHLYFAHLSVRIAAEADILLPSHRIAIFDEAHDAATIARDFFGRRMSRLAVVRALGSAKPLGLGLEASNVRQAADAFFEEIRDFRASDRYQIRLRRPDYAEGGYLERSLKQLLSSLDLRERHADNDKEKDHVARLRQAAERVAESLDDFLTMKDENQVYWIEGEDRLAARQIDVSGVLRTHLFKELDSVVMTSATLTAAGTFEFLKRETGADEAEELVVESPFNFRRQARLIVPEMDNGPNDPGFVGEMSGHINAILRRLGGRTMCLFTSYRNLRACSEAARETGLEILVQGTMPRMQLLERFRSTPGTALFATSSFWQGVDIPGEALSCLVIDKIPFLTPEDPLIDALQERRRDIFQTWSLPMAIIDLRQGFGRLIRTKADRGVVVIFDRRLFTARYGQAIRSSLPPAPVSRDLAELDRFFAPPEAATAVPCKRPRRR